jgi:tetratricopeptide (TPR) repeat protein
MRSVPIASLALLGLLSGDPAVAKSPWLPQVSSPAKAEHTGGTARISAIDRQAFQAAWTEGRKLLDLGQYRQAQPLLERAIWIDPNHMAVRRARARTLLTLGYLHWNRALVVQGLIDVRHARWLSPKETGLVELTALLSNLLQRMDRIAGKRKKP